MDFDFSDEQEQLRDAVRKWVDKAYGFARRRSISQAGGFSADAYRELADMGLCGLYVPQDHGGMGMGPVEGMIVMEELGRGLVLEPVAQALMAGTVLQAFAPAELAAAWLPGIASGEKLVVLAHQERAARYRLDRCTTVASLRDGTWSLTGAKSVVCLGDKADALLVPAMIDGRIAMFLVQAQTPGVSTRGYATIDGGRVAVGLLPDSLAYPLARLEPFGFTLVFVLLLSGLLGAVLSPIVRTLIGLLSALM